MRLSIFKTAAAMLCCFSGFAQPDLKPTLVYPADYFPVGTHVFDVMFENIGTATLQMNGFKIGWQVNNGPVTEVLPATPKYGVAPNGPVTRATGNFSVSFPAAGTYTLKVWTKTLAGDLNNANDTFIKTVKVLPYVPAKNVLFEVFKHQGCCPCVGAACYEDSVVSKKANYAVANIYTVKTDALYNAEGDVPDSTWAFAHPAIVFDRFQFPHAYGMSRPVTSFNNSDRVNDMNERDRYYSPLEVSFHSSSFNTSTRQLSVTLKAKAFDTVAGDLRFNLYLTEDSVKAWQACAVPDPYDYYHMHVVRKMCGGGWGQSGSLPATLYPGQEYTYQFTYTVPASYKESRMELIGLVQQYHNDLKKRMVLNCAKIGFMQSLTLAADDVKINDDISLYPNPVHDKLFIRNNSSKTLLLTFINIEGKEVLRTFVDAKTSAVDISSLSSGNYFVRVFNEKSAIKTISLIKN